MSDETVLAALKAHIPTRPEWLALRKEDIVEPQLPIVDAHHHLWDVHGNRYLLDDLLADFLSGHNVLASVHVQCRSMYRASGPEEIKPVGETEFIRGIASRCEQGPVKVAAGIVGAVDLMLGSRVEPVLEAHIEAGGHRFRGIRPISAWHESHEVRAMDILPGILMQKQAREAIACIQRVNLSLDVWAFFTQLDEVLDVCRAFPGLTVVVNHVGGPVGIGPYADRHDSMILEWRKRVALLAACPNAVMKLGGLGMRYAGFHFNNLRAPPSSDLLVEKWKPYIEFCIESFGPTRCMFESNFPVDRGMCNYHVLWNAFKKMTQHYPAEQREYLFSRCAIETYRLAI